MSSDRSEFSGLSSDRKPPYCQKGLIRSFRFFKGSHASLTHFAVKTRLFTAASFHGRTTLDLHLIVVRRVDVHNS